MSVFYTLKMNENKKNLFSMIKGYAKMARINTELSNTDIAAENEALTNYELILAESEDSDCKKRRHFLRRP